MDIDLSVDAIIDAANGKSSWVEFEAVFGETYAKIDDEKRLALNKITEIVKDSFTDVDVDVDFTENGYEIEIEGKIQVTSKNDRKITNNPWVIAVADYSDTFGQETVRVAVLPTEGYLAFSERLREISSLLEPTMSQPVEFKLKGGSDPVTVFSSGVYVDGQAESIWMSTLKNETIKIKFKGGAWDDVPGSFLMFLSKGTLKAGG